MDTTIKIQFYIFLTSIYGGLIAGLAYDIYRISRLCFKPKKLATLIEDLFFWIGIGIIFFYLLNKNNWAELRFYIFLGFFGGGILYLKILSKVLSPFLIRFFNGIIHIFKVIKHSISLPLERSKKFFAKKTVKMKRLKRIPKEAILEIKKYRKIIFKKNKKGDNL
ncbi:MAG: spore cortex biosynthesis protein YabQ [Tissierellia bacterium]|nr:spore cortex biosynthesis protein YabQ [Tissierellia bacterium]